MINETCIRPPDENDAAQEDKQKLDDVDSLSGSEMSV